MLALLIGAWSLTVGAGMVALWQHALTPGPTGLAKPNWPAAANFARSSALPTLVMTLHPECPCSRASVNELEVLVSRCPGKLSAYVLFAEPGTGQTEIQSTPLWRSAAQIPGVKLIADSGAEMTRRLGAQTSGQVFLYDADGVLKFSGGLTAARGHEGDNDGLDAIIAIVNGLRPDVQTTPAYGCNIW